MKAPLITVDNICMDFDGTHALKNISFEIHEGEILGIIGRSGAGKTVLMHLMRGVEQPPTSGKIVYHVSACPSCDYMDVASSAGKPCPHCGGKLEAIDVDLWNEANDALKRRVMRRTAIMFQRTFALYGDDRVIENVLHALDDISYPQDKAINRAADLIDQVRLSHRMMHIARDLSGGEKQRVVLARQLAKEPFLLFADEPTGTLDPGTAKIVHTMLKEAAATNNMGMVVTSHFSQVIEDVASRALLLVDGSIAKIGTPKEVIGEFMKGCEDTEAFEHSEAGREDCRRPRPHEALHLCRPRRGQGRKRRDLRCLHEGNLRDHREERGGKDHALADHRGTDRTHERRDQCPDRRRMGRHDKTWHHRAGPGKGVHRPPAPGVRSLPAPTVLDNLTDAIGLEFPKELAMRKAIITLKMAGFSEEKSKEILDRLPSHLSEGERHRVALAQVLIREPKIVILDEPTGTMDPITKIDVKHSIMHSRDDIDETFIVVSHDMEFVH